MVLGTNKHEEMRSHVCNDRRSQKADSCLSHPLVQLCRFLPSGQAGLWLLINLLCLPREGLTACGVQMDREIQPDSARQEGTGLGPS